MFPAPRAAFTAACLIGPLTWLAGGDAARADAPDAAAAVDAFGDPLPPGAVARLGTSRLRHACLALAWAPDGKTFATAGNDAAVHVWDAADGKEVRQFKGPGVWFNTILFDPDGKRLIAAGQDGVVHVLDAATGREVRAFGGLAPPFAQIAALAWRPDDGTVVTLGFDQTLRVWDLTTGKLTRQVDGSVAGNVQLNRVALSPDGRRFASWVPGDMLTVRDDGGKELFHALTQLKSVDGFLFSPDGKKLAASSSAASQVVLWDVETGKEVRRLEGVRLIGRALAFSPDGKYFAGRGGNGAVHVWGAASGKDLREFELRQGMLIGTMNSSGTPLAFSPDGKTLAGAQGLAIHIWDVEGDKETGGLVGHNAPVADVRFYDDGRRVLTCGTDGAVGQWDAATGKLLAWRTRTEGGFASAQAAAPDGKAVFYAALGGVSRWDLAADKPVDRPVATGLTGYPSALVLSADGKTLAAYAPDRSIVIWDAEKGKEKGRVKNDQAFVPAFALSPDGGLLAIGLPNAPVRLWDVAAGSEVRQLDAGPPSPAVPAPGPVPAGQVRGATQLAFSPDGRTLATVWNAELTVWEVATGRDRMHIARPGAATARIAFSPDGGLMAVGAFNGSLSLLDATDGWELAQFAGPAGAVSALVFAPDGKTLASADADGTALIWDVKEWCGRNRPAAELAADRLPVLWKDLLDADASRAYKAVLALAASPKAAAPYLKEQLAGAVGPDDRRVAKLIEQLNDDQFDVRESAQRELEKMEGEAIPAVRQALSADPPPESRRRLQELVGRRKEATVVTEEVRGLRGVEALERSGAAEAEEALRALAKDGPNARLKQEAGAALDRLARRAAAP